MRVLSCLVILVGCGGSPAPRPTIAPQDPVDTRAPTTVPADEPTPEPVAVGDPSADPCEGGEVAGDDGGPGGTGVGGGGTGEGTIGLGRGGGSIGGKGGGDGFGIGGGGSRTTKAPRVQPGEGSVAGSIDTDAIRRVIRQHLGALRFCYERKLAANPTLQGVVVAKFTIDATGSVSAATASGLDPEVDACIAARLKALKFPRADGGGAVTITYPFTFSPT